MIPRITRAAGRRECAAKCRRHFPQGEFTSPEEVRSTFGDPAKGFAFCGEKGVGA